MELREAYRVLELAPGATEEAVRDARKTLVKVWHPDRHANDPELQKRAEIKLGEINAAFEAVRAGGVPGRGAAGRDARRAATARANAGAADLVEVSSTVTSIRFGIPCTPITSSFVAPMP